MSVLRPPSPGRPLPADRLADRLAVTDVVHAYARLVDANETEAVAELFTEGCVVDYGPAVGEPLHGRAALAERLARALAPHEATSHLCGNVEVWFEGDDVALAITYVTAWHRPRRADRADVTVRAQYHDRLVRTTDGWRIAERHLHALGVDGATGAWRRAPRRD